jgi:hypothetical protein
MRANLCVLQFSHYVAKRALRFKEIERKPLICQQNLLAIRLSECQTFQLWIGPANLSKSDSTPRFENSASGVAHIFSMKLAKPMLNRSRPAKNWNGHSVSKQGKSLKLRSLRVRQRKRTLSRRGRRRNDLERPQAKPGSATARRQIAHIMTSDNLCSVSHLPSHSVQAL